MTPTLLAAYVALFVAVGAIFLLVSMLLGRFLRPRDPTPARLETYECGEPAVGSAYVQFDLRFYVVALLFIIFEVEVALFFPPATVFGKATHLIRQEMSGPAATIRYQELGAPQPEFLATSPRSTPVMRHLALAALLDLGVFFAVLLVAFAYLWYRGDLNWVRAIDHGDSGVATETPTAPADLRVATMAETLPTPGQPQRAAHEPAPGQGLVASPGSGPSMGAEV